MAYDNKLGYDPDLDYTTAYATETDPINRGRLAEARGKKKAAMIKAGTYDTSWDASWDKVYGVNPVMGMDSNGSYGAYGSTPIGQMGMGGTKTNPYAGVAASSNPYTTQYPVYTEPQASVNPYLNLQKQAEQNLSNIKQTQLGQVNQMYDNQAKQAYIQREQNNANMPKQLAAQGITGGMAESTAARIGTAYGNQLATNESARMGAVNDINIASSQQAMQIALDYADRIIAQKNADRSYNRGVYESDRGFNYQQGRDAVSDNQWQTSFDRGIFESDRGFAYQQNRDAVGDSQWNKSFDRGVLESDRGFAYQQGRDTVADNRYNTEWAYGVGRDNIADQRYANETAYNRGRDTIGDQQWQQQFGYNAYRDNVGDNQWQQQFGYNQQQDTINNAYRQQNAQVTSTPYSMSGYVKNLVDAYGKSEGKYDLIGSLNIAYDSGLISAQDYAAALIQTGVDPYAKEKAAATAQATEANKANAYATIQNWTDNPSDLGYGPLSQDKLQQLIDDGKVIGKYENGRFYYKRP